MLLLVVFATHHISGMQLFELMHVVPYKSDIDYINIIIITGHDQI